MPFFMQTPESLTNHQRMPQTFSCVNLSVKKKRIKNAESLLSCAIVFRAMSDIIETTCQTKMAPF